MYETGICIVHLHKKTVELKTIWALFRSFYLSFSILHKFIKKGKELWHEWKAAKEKSSICSLNIFQSFVTSCTVAQSTHIQTYTYTYTCAVRRQVWRYYAKHWTPDSQFTWELAEIGASIDRIKLVEPSIRSRTIGAGRGATTIRLIRTHRVSRASKQQISNRYGMS